MSNGENLHAGHRERMRERLLNNPHTFTEHELLETLLFYSVPRKNTNDLAHKILRMFGSLDNVFAATTDELKTVDGVGDKVAAEIILVGAIVKQIAKKSKPKREILSFDSVKRLLSERMKGLKEEKFLLLLLDKNYREKAVIEFGDELVDSVSADVSEIAKALAMQKPAFAIIAHNHPSGKIEPSQIDDYTTKQINLLCSVHCVELVDHVIISGDKFYSYHHNDRLLQIKREANLNKIFN